MARIAGVDLPRGKRIEVALTYIYGIGDARARRILANTGIDPALRTHELGDEDVNRLRREIEGSFKVEGALRTEVSMNIKRLMDIGCYRGLRHRRGLPVRGQRTHTNARTHKGARRAIAGKIGQKNPFKSLQLGVRANAYGGSEVRTRMCYAGPAQPLAPQDDPLAVFNQLFSNFSVGETNTTEQQKQGSILDTVHSQFKRLKSRVGQRDRQKLDAHAAKVRELEERLQQKPSSKDSCQKPGQPPELNPDSAQSMNRIMDLQCDLAVMALACDLTRVVSIQVSNAMNHHTYPWIGSNTGGHTLSHAGPSDTQAHEEWMKRDKWHAQKFAKLLGKLDNIPEGDGTMLDNTCLLWINELSRGNTHSHDDMPFVLAGNVGGQFKTGRYIEYQSSKYHNDLLAALGKAYGLQTDTFGHPDFSNGALASLT